MLKLASGTVFAGVIAAASVAAAAPPMPCADKSARNCFVDDVFLLSGNETVMRDGMAVPVVKCASGTDCYLNSTADLFKADGLTATVTRALELIKASNPTLPEWDEIVVFSADFGPKTQPGPLFFRMKNAAGTAVNRVKNIGLGDVVEPDVGPYLGIIDGGNLKTVGANPGSGTYSPCGRLPRPTTNPPSSSEQAAGAICAPGVYNYFDALAQATAALYGPHLAMLDPMGAKIPMVVKPTIKSTLVDAMGVLKTSVDPNLSADIWNSFFDTRGSLLGGNTWRSNGNGTYDAVRPPTFQGASPPDDARSALRFQPLDLYVLGFAPAAEVPALKSFATAVPGDVFNPPSQTAFGPTAGPNMGVRTAAVQLRGKSGVPNNIAFQTIVDANGGPRDPAAETARQSIRQLWIVVTKPDAARDLVAKEAYDAALKAKPDDVAGAEKAQADSLTAQAKEQDTEVANIQKIRRQWNQYFYLMTTYRGRALTTFDNKADDLAYWEFADTADEQALFAGGGGIVLEMRGPEAIPNSGGLKQTVLSVMSTPGLAGTITYTPGTATTLLIQGNQKVTTAPNNVFSVRMRLPADSSLAGKVKAKVQLTGPDGTFDATIPSLEGAFLVPDGRFRTYSVLLSHTTSVEANTDAMATDPEVVKMTENTAYTGKNYTGFVFTPSTEMAHSIDIEYLRIGNYADVSEKDRDCDGGLHPDGFIGPDDNCPNFFNPNQVDTDQDGIGDDCEDFDGDRVINACDNCSTVTNATQSDVNNDTIGDSCDPTFEGVGCALRRGTVSNLPRGGLALLAAGALVLAGRRWRRRRSRGRSFPA